MFGILKRLFKRADQKTSTSGQGNNRGERQEGKVQASGLQGRSVQVRRGARIILWSSVKGGVGKSSIASQMALILGAMGKTILYVDTDIVNNTGSNILISVFFDPKTRRFHEEVNKLLMDITTFTDLIIKPPGRIKYVNIHASLLPEPLASMASVRVARDARIPIKGVFLIPARRQDRIDTAGGTVLTGEQLANLGAARMVISRLAETLRVDYVFIDMPTLAVNVEQKIITDPIQRTVFSWGDVVWVVPSNESELKGNLEIAMGIHSRVNLHQTLYGVVVSQYPSTMFSGLERSIKNFMVSKGFQNVRVSTVRSDEKWSSLNEARNLYARPPVVEHPIDASHVAALDVIRTAIRLGLITVVDADRLLNFSIKEYFKRIKR